MKSAERFVEEMLALIRRDFLRKLSARQFYQEKPMLMQAITYPARWLSEHGTGATATIGIVRRVLMTVIGTIKSKGDTTRIERFSVYFSHCVQRHMMIRGEGYYMAAKAPRSLASLVPGTMRRIAGAADSKGQDSTVENLAEVHRVLSGRARIRKGRKTAFEMDLFSHCKDDAKSSQKDRNLRQTFANPADSAGYSPTLDRGAADSNSAP
jgi:hypothetical protein